MSEPHHASDSDAASIRFSWTPDFTGTASIETAGSDFDSLLAAYTGRDVASLTLVGSSDDVGESALTSRVCFHVSAGSAWKIVVDGFAGDSGNVALNWGPKADANPCPTLPPQVTGPTGAPKEPYSTAGR